MCQQMVLAFYEIPHRYCVGKRKSLWLPISFLFSQFRSINNFISNRIKIGSKMADTLAKEISCIVQAWEYGRSSD